MKRLLISGFVLLALVLGLFYWTHRSIDQDLSQEDLALKEILIKTSKKETSIVAPIVEPEVLPEVLLEKKPLEAQKDKPEEVGRVEEVFVPTPEPEVSAEPEVLKTGQFNTQAQGSDTLHRGGGGFKLVSYKGVNKIIFEEDFWVTNGPDYKLYLLEKTNIETESAFFEVKDGSPRISEVKQFKGYQSFDVPASVDVDNVSGALIWCERFSEFITSGDFE